MPRGPRLDAPRALPHVIACGIERRWIFVHDADRQDFLAGQPGCVLCFRFTDRRAAWLNSS